MVDADAVYRVTDMGQIRYQTPQEVETNLNALARGNRTANAPSVPSASVRAKRIEPPKVQQLPRGHLQADASSAGTLHALGQAWYFIKPAGAMGLAIGVGTTLLAAIVEKTRREYAIQLPKPTGLMPSSRPGNANVAYKWL